MKGYYQYFLNRTPVGINFPIQFGVGYHKFRELLENLYISQKFDIAEVADRRALYQLAWSGTLRDWEEPPVEHKHSYLTEARLAKSCDEAFETWLDEKRSSRYNVLYTEQAFDLVLPSGRRYGGRFDQIIEWNKRLWIRDFKTTSRMGKNFAHQFDPNNQFTGYIWAAQILSGRPVDGVIVEVVYNTKTKGPEFFEYLVTRTQGQLDRWIESVEFELDEIDSMFDEDRWPMRTTACNDYGGCYFRDACKKSTWYAIEQWLKTYTTRSVWDFMNPESEEGVVD